MTKIAPNARKLTLSEFVVLCGIMEHLVDGAANCLGFDARETLADALRAFAEQLTAPRAGQAHPDGAPTARDAGGQPS